MKVRRTRVFTKWFETLRDGRAKARIDVRIGRLAAGNAGIMGTEIIILLCGGDKSTQHEDIKQAKLLAAQMEEK